MHAMPGSAALPHEGLSPREFEVLRLLVNGASVTSIAGQINLSVKTVSSHKTNLLQKMGLQSQSDLIHYAIKHGLVDQGAA